MILIAVAERGLTALCEDQPSRYAASKLIGVTNVKRREEIFLGDAVRDVLFAPFGIERDAVCTREGGKPYAIGHEDVGFSISHSGRLAVGAIVPSGQIGIDIECVKERDEARRERIMRRVFSEAERKRVAECDPITEFYAVWTRKEAYLKYTGQGIAAVGEADTESELLGVSFRTFRLCDAEGHSYICSVAAEKTHADKGLDIKRI